MPVRGASIRIAPNQYRWRRVLLAIALLAQIVALLLAGGRHPIAGAPCPPAPPPPQDSCNAAPGVPCLPNTGGGGCAIDPTSCAPPDGGSTPASWDDMQALLAASTSTARVTIAIAADTGLFAQAVAAPPGDPAGCGNPSPGDPPVGGGSGSAVPPSTPVPLTPVCAACEAPGLAASVETPAVRVRTNPESGLVNVPTWLWAEGYRGQDLFASRSWSPPYEPTMIEVRYVVKRYLWNFGDGGQIESRSLGQPYPAESDIKNAYGWSSRAEPGGVFHVALTIEWNVEYRVNGGPPQPLPPVQRRYEAHHPVRELQPIVTGP